MTAANMHGDLADRIPSLKGEVDLAALVERYAGPGRTSGGRTTFRCPHPAHDDHRPSFTVHGDRWRCWSACDRSGDAIDLLVWLEGLTTAEAIERLAGPSSCVTTKEAATNALTSPPAFLNEIVDEHPVVDHQPGDDGELHHQAVAVVGDPDHPDVMAFWERRGWHPDTATGLGLSAVTDRYGRTRIRFPFRVGDVVPYHQDRATTDHGPKWLSPAGARPIPYEGDRLNRAHEVGEVVVVEGVTDAATIIDTYADPAVVGIPGAAAWRAEWAAPFRGLRVFVFGDNDAAGTAFAEKVAADIADVGAEVYRVFVPDEHNDIADWRAAVGVEAFAYGLDAALNASMSVPEARVHPRRKNA